VGALLEELGGRPSEQLARSEPRSYLYRASFSGRAELLRTLQGEIIQAQEGQGRAVFLSGPSGAGKTRLAVELARRAVRAGMLVLSSECAVLGQAEGEAHEAPFQGFRALLRSVADRCRDPG